VKSHWNWKGSLSLCVYPNVLCLASVSASWLWCRCFAPCIKWVLFALCRNVVPKFCSPPFIARRNHIKMETVDCVSPNFLCLASVSASWLWCRCFAWILFRLYHNAIAKFDALLSIARWNHIQVGMTDCLVESNRIPCSWHLCLQVGYGADVLHLIVNWFYLGCVMMWLQSVMHLSSLQCENTHIYIYIFQLWCNIL
jgi:hypothetical protein